MKIISEFAANAGHATLQLDVKNAFNELDRNAMLRAARRFGPSLYGFAAALYGNGKQDLAYFLDGADVEAIECETGVTQGCGLGTLLFALAFHECIIAELEADQAKELPDREFKDIMIYIAFSIGNDTDDVLLPRPWMISTRNF